MQQTTTLQHHLITLLASFGAMLASQYCPPSPPPPPEGGQAMQRRLYPHCLVTALLPSSQPSLRRWSPNVWLSTAHWRPDFWFKRLTPPLFLRSLFNCTWLPSKAKQLNLAKVPIDEGMQTCGQSTCASTMSCSTPEQDALPPLFVTFAASHVVHARQQIPISMQC